MLTSQPPTHDIVNSLVPPPRSRWRSVALAVIVLALLVGIVIVPRSGIIVPGVAGGAASAYSNGHAPWVQFSLRNRGWVPLDLTAIDGRAKGLAGPTMDITEGTGATKIPGATLMLPVRLEPGHEITVRLSFSGVDCAAIDPGAFDMPVRASGPFGVTLKVRTQPGGFTRPMPAFVSYTGRNPYAIGWAAGLTWQDCHGRPSA